MSTGNNYLWSLSTLKGEGYFRIQGPGKTIKNYTDGCVNTLMGDFFKKGIHISNHPIVHFKITRFCQLYLHEAEKTRNLNRKDFKKGICYTCSKVEMIKKGI